MWARGVMWTGACRVLLSARGGGVPLAILALALDLPVPVPGSGLMRILVR